MSMVKRSLENRICKLAEASGYDEEELMDMWFDYVDERHEDGEPIDWGYFAGVTMEHDW